MVKIKELREKGAEELSKQLSDLRMELIKSNSQVASGTTPKNPGQIKDTKKTIAKIITLLKEKSNTEEKKKHE